MLRRIAASLKYRAKWARLGVFYGKSLKLDRVRIARRRIDLSFPAFERRAQEHEFGKIVFDDYYRLRNVPDVQTVLDIGANIGLFALAARRAFPKAVIHCYEPNPAIFRNLENHCIQADCEYFPSAVGFRDGRVSLENRKSGTLFSTTTSNPLGQIDQISFAKAVNRLGQVDLLKLDCEGAEWEIFHDHQTWQRVKNLVMEYHLRAQAGATAAILKGQLFYLGFDDVEIKEGTPAWGLAFARRR